MRLAPRAGLAARAKAARAKAARRLAARAVGAWLASAAVLGPAEARAHDFRPGVLALTETASGAYDLVWTPPVDTRAEVEPAPPSFPAHCERAGARLDCGGRGLVGAISFAGLPASGSVLVVVRSLDGRVVERRATAGSPRVELGEPGGMAWLRTGVEHVLRGPDHLAFVAGLLLVAGPGARLLAAISAFTVAHSLTLALGALGAVRPPPLAVEAAIAASVVLVAREALVQAPTLARRAPWVAALAVGLVHGLGFAGAVREAGLPRASVPAAVALFNVGVELGQIALVGLLLLLGRALAAGAPRAAGRARAWACYGLGALGGFWFCERALPLVEGAVRARW